MGRKSRAKREARQDHQRQRLAGPLAQLRLTRPNLIYRPPAADSFRAAISKFGVSPALVEQAVEGRTKDLAEIALQRLRERMPSELVAILPPPDELDVGVIGQFEMNAFAGRISKELPAVIALHEGLPFVLYAVARALTSRIAIAGEDPAERARVPDIAVAAIGEVVRNYLGFAAPGVLSYEVGPERLRIAGTLAMDAEMTVIAHEVSHLLLGHVNRPGPPSHQTEHEADELGWKLVLNSPLEAEDPDRFRLEFAAADLALQTQLLLVRARFGGRERASPTHPPIAERLERLRDLGRSWCGDNESSKVLFSLPELVRSTFDEVLAGLK